MAHTIGFASPPQLISYTSGSTYVHDHAEFTNGLSFAATDPSAGDASLSMVLLKPAQSATYQCKVKKLPGVDMLKVSLVILGESGFENLLAPLVTAGCFHTALQK